MPTQTDRWGRFSLQSSRDAGGSSILKVGGGERPALHVQAWPGRETVIVLPRGGALVGHVLNPVGHGVPGRVLARGGDWAEEVVANRRGEFRFQSVPGGLIDLLVRPTPGSDSIPARGEVIVRPGAEAQVTLRCATGQTLRGRVETRSGAPAGGASLLIWSALGSSQDARRSKCAADGTFSLAGLEPGELLLCARHEDGSEGPIPVLVPLGADPDPLEVRLRANRRLDGRVIDSRGRPLKGISLRLTGPTETLQSISAGEGQFGFGSVPSGDYAIEVSGDGFVTLRERVRFLPRGPRLLVEMVRAAEVSGSVFDAEGAPLANAIVDAQLPDRRQTRSDAQGRFRLRGLPPGGVRLRARAEGLGAGVADLLLSPGEAVRQDLVLVPPTEVSGRVFDGEGAPLRGAAVWVTGPGDERLTRSDVQGTFRIAELGTGPFLVSASKNGFKPASQDYVGPGARVELYLEATLPLTGIVLTSRGDPVYAVLVAPANAPEQAQLFEGSRFAIVVGIETRQLIVRARSGEARHGHGPSFLSPQYVNVPPGGGHLRIELSDGVEATGIVRDAGGRPLGGVAFLFGRQREVQLGGEAGRIYLLGISEDEGEFHLPALPPEGMRVTLSHPEHGPLVVQLAPGGDQSFRLPPGAVLSGYTLDSGGRPQAGVPVVIAGPLVRRTTSDAEGRYRAEGLGEGRYRVTRFDTQQSRDVELVAGETKALDLR